MKIIRKIALAELQLLFYSPIAWIILIVFTIQAALFFTNIFDRTVQTQDLHYHLENVTFRLFANPYNGFFIGILEYLYLYIPLLTMGLMSRELGSGSINLLYSSPVRNSQIILGKFLSMMAYGVVLIVILSVFVIFAGCTVKEFDWSLILGGLLGIYLLICAYVAIGLFMSSLTSYQVVAVVSTLIVLAFLNTVSRFGQEHDFIREITYWLSINGRVNEAIGGLLCSEDLLYFLIVSGLFLSLSILRLKSVRQKSSWGLSWSKYTGVVIAAMLLGYLTSRPTLMGFHDTTRTKQRTLTENSQQIIRRAEGELKMTVYVNALDDDIWNGLPRNRKNDLENFAQYIRFKPEMEVKYVYYYADTGDPMLAKRYPGLSISRMVGEICRSYRIDSTMFLPPEKIAQSIDLAPEGYRIVRLLEGENGQRTFLRMFNDMQRYPSEMEISAALKRLVMELPVVGFLSGHGERDYTMEGDLGYYQFAQDKWFRYALINQGFDCQEVTLDDEIPAHITILTIADMRRALTPAEQVHLDAYIARGGNLLVLGEPRRQEVMNPIVAPLGVQFMPGQLVKWSGTKPVEEEEEEVRRMFFNPKKQVERGNNFSADFIQSRLTRESREVSYRYDQMYRDERVVTMPGCVGLAYSEERGFKVIPLMRSDTIESWNELETTDFIDDTVRLNPAIGEVVKSYPTALALSRQVNGKEQKVIIIGDADCISNGEITRGRAKVLASNYDMLMGSFFWLSDNEVPIDIRRPTPPDNTIFMTGVSANVSKWFLTGLFPLLLLASCLVIWLRRRGR
ncbi:MAG: Gldg family protein [Odoribacteraceae bacterium]|jgi:ABC-2 type transport system permease protein|nr:Gldg family protein [Odoribacteraceae bacterium]